MASTILLCGDCVRVVGPSSDGSTFATGEVTRIVDIRKDEDGQTAFACPIDGWGVVNFPRTSLALMPGSKW